MWEDYADRFEFVISSVVRDEIRKGDATAAQQRLEMVSSPILEECYRIKAEISAQFKNPGEYYRYLKAMEAEDKRNEVKYVSYFDPSKRTPPEKSEDND